MSWLQTGLEREGVAGSWLQTGLDRGCGCELAADRRGCSCELDRVGKRVWL